MIVEISPPNSNAWQSELFFCLALHLPVLQITKPGQLGGTCNKVPVPGFVSLFLQLKETARFRFKDRGQEIKEDCLWSSEVFSSLQSLIGLAGLTPLNKEHERILALRDS